MMSETESGKLSSVSVVIPCYNYGHFLPRCIDSVLSQAGAELRVLIIDDFSSDGSRAQAESLAAQHSQVEVRAHDRNAGHIATYNEGLLDWADGDYVTLLSADDMLTPGSLARSVRILDEHPDVGMVYGRCVEFTEANELPPLGRDRGAIISDGKAWIRSRASDGSNVVPTPGTVVRTSIHKQAGGYDPSLPHAGDFEMWLRIAVLSKIGFVRGAAQGYYRIHSTSMSHYVYQEALADLRQRALVFESIFRRHGQELEPAGIKLEATRAQLATQALWTVARAYEKGTVSELPLGDCIDFAQVTYPGMNQLRAYRALRRRERLGEQFCHRTQLFIATTAVRKLRNMLWWAKWKRTGG